MNMLIVSLLYLFTIVHLNNTYTLPDPEYSDEDEFRRMEDDVNDINEFEGDTQQPSRRPPNRAPPAPARPPVYEPESKVMLVGRIDRIVMVPKPKQFYM